MPDVIYAIMRQRRNTYAYFTQNNPVLEDGQIGIINTGQHRGCFKVGDGATGWNSLPWVTDYSILFNKPAINGVTLNGSRTITDFGGASLGDLTGVQTALNNETAARQQEDTQLQANITAEAAARQNADNTHAALTTVHGSTPTPASSRIAMYGAEGGLKSNKIPSAQNDVIRKTELDTETQARTSADTGLQTNKLDKKPDGTNPLIGDGYKLNPQYLPAAVTGALVYGGTFTIAGVIYASSYAPELQGVLIGNVNTGAYPGFYFISQGAYAFGGSAYSTGDWAISQGAHSPAWVKIDNGNAVSSVNGKTGTAVLTKADVGLGNADNTSDMDKPVSTAQQAAISAETGARESAINTVNSAVQAEETARQNADNAHAALTAVHGSTPAPASTRIAMYGAEGGLKSDKMPVQSNDVIRKTELDAEEARAKGVEGALASLSTTVKTNLAAAINEVNGECDTNAAAIAAEEARAKGVEGALAGLTTTDQTSLVAAINELNGELDSFPALIRTLDGKYNIGSLAGAYITALQ